MGPLTGESRARRLGWVALALGVAAAAVALAFGPIVRWRVARAADRLGAEISVGSVGLGLGRITLRDLRIRIPRVPELVVRVDQAAIGPTPTGRVGYLEARGGTVDVTGDLASVRRDLGEWWSSVRTPASPKGGTGGAEVRWDGVRVTWAGAMAGADPLVGEGVSLERRGGSIRVVADRASWSRRRSLVVIRGAELATRREGATMRLASARAEALDVSLDLAEFGARREDGPPTEAVAANTAQAPVAGARPWRDRAIAAAQRWAEWATPEASIAVGDVHAVVRRGDQELHAGPGAFRVVRDGERLRFDLTPGAASAGAPLTGTAWVPFAPGELAFELRGGPVTLASLGIHEGDFGLVDVGGATVDARLNVRFGADARAVDVDGEGKLHALAIANTRLAADPVRGLELAWRLRGSGDIDATSVRIDEGEVDLGAARLVAHGSMQRGPDFLRLQGKAEAPPAGCQAMLDSIPRALVPHLVGTRVEGTWALDAEIDVDTRHLEDMRVDWKTANGCRVTSVPEAIDVSRFSRPFRRMVYDPAGERLEIASGPGTPDWVPLHDVSPFVEAALLTSEDGGFRRHDGFDRSAIRNSIRDNLRARRFVRGASTLTMQLAKNLYLDREKTLARKLQEAVLTMYLEQALTKDQILELYVNVVELGPMVYGIGPAARYWFGTSANDLTVAQATYLASILPNPKRSYASADGKLSPRWAEYVRKLVSIEHDRKRINDEEMAAGLEEELELRGAHAGGDGAEPIVPADDEIDRGGP